MDMNDFDQQFDRVVFEFETNYGVFRDALVFPKGMLPEETTIEQIKQERLLNFINHIENPKPSIDYVLDSDGLNVLDENGNPIPVQR